MVSRSNALYDNTRRIRVTHRTEAPSRPLYPAFIRTRRTFDVPAPPAQPIGVGLDPAIYTGTVPRIVAHRRAAKDGRVKPGHDGWGGRWHDGWGGRCTPSVSRALCGLVLLEIIHRRGGKKFDRIGWRAEH